MTRSQLTVFYFGPADWKSGARAHSHKHKIYVINIYIKYLIAPNSNPVFYLAYLLLLLFEKKWNFASSNRVGGTHHRTVSERSSFTFRQQLADRFVFPSYPLVVQKFGTYRCESKYVSMTSLIVIGRRTGKKTAAGSHRLIVTRSHTCKHSCGLIETRALRLRLY